jgi:hypothetical protein
MLEIEEKKKMIKNKYSSLKFLNYYIIIIFIISVLFSGCTIDQSTQNLSSAPSSTNSDNNSIYPTTSPTSSTESLADKVVQADLIVLGTITDLSDEYPGHKDNATGFYNYFTLSIEKTIKGDTKLKSIYIRCYGKMRGTQTVAIINGYPDFALADHVISCLKRIEADIYEPLITQRHDEGFIWIEGKTLRTEATSDEVIARVILIMKANNIPIALPQNEIPPLPTTAIRNTTR